MYQSNCYNYEGLKNWLSQNLIEDKNCKFTYSSHIIASNFSRCYFQVSDRDVFEALSSLGYTFETRNEEYYFSFHSSSPAFKHFEKFWE